jgi:hypothetical protein
MSLSVEIVFYSCGENLKSKNKGEGCVVDGVIIS